MVLDCRNRIIANTLFSSFRGDGTYFCCSRTLDKGALIPVLDAGHIGSSYPGTYCRSDAVTSAPPTAAKFAAIAESQSFFWDLQGRKSTGLRISKYGPERARTIGFYAGT